MSEPTKKVTTEPLSEVLSRAGKRALGGGLPGAVAMVTQVLSLLWLRTTMNYQYRYGMTTTQALRTLYREGGVRRFYRGLLPALFQGPLARFGDTAANAGALSLMESYESTKDLPVAVKTSAASTAAALWRINLMPIDTTKTIMQVEGKDGFKKLVRKFRTSGFPVLYHGALAAASASWVGHFPWFFTYNYLQEVVPQFPDHLGKRLARNAGIGFVASCVSDTCSNSIRVVKTYKQSSTEAVTYPQAVKSVLKENGVIGLLGRGLRTRILANGLQGAAFSVGWRYFQEVYYKGTPPRG